MNFAVIRDSLLDKIKSKIFDIKDIEIFISDLINFLGINDYLKEIQLVSSDNENDLAFYNFDTRVFKISYDNIVKEAVGLFDGDDEDYSLFVNLDLLLSVIHEIVHIYQNYVISECDYDLFKIYSYELASIDDISKENYAKYYMYFIFEREAVCISYEAIIKLLHDYIHHEELLDYFISELTKTLNIGYKSVDGGIISPIEILFKEVYKIDAPYVEVKSIYDAYKLGVQVKNSKKKLNDKIVKKRTCTGS